MPTMRPIHPIQTNVISQNETSLQRLCLSVGGVITHVM